MEYIGHTSEDGRKQPLSQHLIGVAKLSGENSVDSLKDCAELCGLMHDIGKYTEEFQKHIRGVPVKVGHALCGAQEIYKISEASYSYMMEYCIAGHHTGLPDGGTKADRPDMSTLYAILKRETGNYSAYANEISVKFPKDNLRELMKDCRTKEEIIELYSFFTRYLFSCLTDADFIDTERFVSPDTDRSVEGNFQKAYEAVCKKTDSFRAETPLQKARGSLQEQVYKAVDTEADIYTLNMPTGSGKTLCGIRAALKTLLKKNKKRIIYVIPYISIIEQTAEIFEDIFGRTLPVVQHHSNYDLENTESENELTQEKLRHVCENWDAPLIVTTNIQFFESLYHYRSSRLRKLHNLADSIIIFDEIHMLPAEYIKPCLKAIGYITKYLNSTVFLMSATMPDYENFAKKFVMSSKITDAVGDKRLFKAFDKCCYKYIGKTSPEKLAEMARECGNALIIVNKRGTARELYDICEGKKYHLSTYMTPKDRSEVIREIKENIHNGVKITVVSTSLIEAGVDLDFETVFRENAGIDNILQSGGRCNREGKRERGNVFVFETDGGSGEIQLKSNITRSLFSEFEDISSDKCIKEYYNRLFAVKDGAIENNSITSLMGENLSPDSIPFRTYAERFRFIDNQVIGIVIPDEENRELIEELKYGKLSAKRRLQKYCASVKPYELERMLKEGIVKQLECGVCVLSNPDYYNKYTGLSFTIERDYII